MFSGTAVQVYGTVPAGPGTVRSTYSIDNGSPVTAERLCGSAIGYAQPFFDRQGLSEGEHILVVTNIGSEVDFRLDRIDWLPNVKDLASETPLPPPV